MKSFYRYLVIRWLQSRRLAALGQDELDALQATLTETQGHLYRLAAIRGAREIFPDEIWGEL